VVAAERETVNVAGFVPLLPSGSTVALPTEIAGTTGDGGTVAESSLTIVPVPVAVPRVTFVGEESVTVNVSLGSTAVSPLTETENVCEV
jgi:hypothetical protein